MSKWKPMDTAPKDGSELLLWDGKRRATGSWTRPAFNDPIMHAMADGQSGYWCHTGSAFKVNAVAWLPLPSPP